MSSDFIVIHLANGTAVGPGLLPPGSPTWNSHDGDGWLLLISTRVSTTESGSPPRAVQLTLRGDVQSTQPMVVDHFQGMDTGCILQLLGSAATLELAGGAAQLLGYTLGQLVPHRSVTVVRPVDARQEHA